MMAQPADNLRDRVYAGTADPASLSVRLSSKACRAVRTSLRPRACAAPLSASRSESRSAWTQPKARCSRHRARPASRPPAHAWLRCRCPAPCAKRTGCARRAALSGQHPSARWRRRRQSSGAARWDPVSRWRAAADGLIAIAVGQALNRDLARGVGLATVAQGTQELLLRRLRDTRRARSSRVASTAWAPAPVLARRRCRRDSSPSLARL